MKELPPFMLKDEFKEVPEWVTGYIGHCPTCGKGDLLIFVLRNSKGQYLHCMMCNTDFRENMNC